MAWSELNELYKAVLGNAEWMQGIKKEGGSKEVENRILAEQQPGRPWVHGLN